MKFNWRWTADALLLVACCLMVATVAVCAAGIAGRGNPQFLDFVAFALLAGGGVASLCRVLARIRAGDESTRSSPPSEGSSAAAPLLTETAVLLLAVASIVLWSAFAFQSYLLTEVPVFSRSLLAAMAERTGSGWFGQLAAIPLDQIDRREQVFRLLGLYAAVAVLYLALTLLVPRLPRISRRSAVIVVATPILAHIILAIGPGLLSSDVLSYAMYGHLAGLDGANPYLTPPSGFPADPFMANDIGQWRSQVSVYGPVWNDLSALLSRAVAGAGLVGELLAYRALAAMFQLANFWLFWILLNQWPATRGLSLPSRLGRWALFSWNPNLLIEVGQSAHNDVVIVSSIIVSLLALAPAPGQQLYGSDRVSNSTANVVRWLGAVLALIVGALMKFVPVVLIPLEGLAFWVGLRSWRDWLRIGALTAVVSAVAFVVPSIHWMNGADVLLPFRTALQGGPVTTNDLPHEPAQWITARFLDIYSEHTQKSRDAAAAWISAGMRFGFAVYVLIELAWLWRLRRAPQAAMDALPGVCARFLTLFILLVLHQVRSWYFIWAIPLAGVVQPRSVTGVLVVVMGLCAFPALLLVNESIWPGGFLLMLEIAVPAALALLIEAAGRWRQWEAETPRRHVPAVFESGL